jgi:hypothetical protein
MRGGPGNQEKLAKGIIHLQEPLKVNRISAEYLRQRRAKIGCETVTRFNIEYVDGQLVAFCPRFDSCSKSRTCCDFRRAEPRII